VKDGEHTYYSFIVPVRFRTAAGAYISSPGPERPHHGPLPKGARKVAHIHIHWEGSEWLHPSNEGFSEALGDRGDENLFPEFKKMHWYVIGSKETLYGRYPQDMKAKDERWPKNTDKAKEYALGHDFYASTPATNDPGFRLTPEELKVVGWSRTRVCLEALVCSR